MSRYLDSDDSRAFLQQKETAWALSFNQGSGFYSVAFKATKYDAPEGNMRITPLDIKEKQFPVMSRGFDVEEVDAFLEESLATTQKMLKAYIANVSEETELLLKRLEKQRP